MNDFVVIVENRGFNNLRRAEILLCPRPLGVTSLLNIISKSVLKLKLNRKTLDEKLEAQSFFIASKLYLNLDGIFRPTSFLPENSMIGCVNDAVKNISVNRVFVVDLLKRDCSVYEKVNEDLVTVLVWKLKVTQQNLTKFYDSGFSLNKHITVDSVMISELLAL